MSRADPETRRADRGLGRADPGLHRAALGHHPADPEPRAADPGRPDSPPGLSAPLRHTPPPLSPYVRYAHLQHDRDRLSPQRADRNSD